MLTMICHREAYEYRAVSCFCNPFADAEKDQDHLQIADIPLVGCPQGYLDLGQMMRICLVKIPRIAWD